MMMASNINSYYVLAFAVAASILRSNCIIHNCPRYRAATYSGTVSIAANDIAMMTSRTFQRLSCGHDSAGSDSLGFSTHLQTNGFVLPTQIIFGSNAIEHGINLIEEKTQNVLLVSGWNSARLDPILWEMEPRGFQLGTCCVTDEPTLEGVHSVVAAALESNCRAIIAMGCGSVIDTAKMAAMLINSNKDTQSLARMTADQLGSSLLSICGSSSSESPLEALLLITIPALPSMGAELSAVAALRLVVQTASPCGSNYLNAEDASDSLEGQLPTLQQELDRTRRVSKFYVQTRSPDLCLIQPSLTYRAPMELVHDRVLGLIGTSIDIILSDPGFDLRVIEDLCRVGAAVASARCAIHVGGLQHLSDYISQKSGVSKGHTRRLGQLLPSYLLALLSWSESEEDVQGSGEPPEGHNSRGKGRGKKDNCKGQGKDDPFKAFVRTKLNRISQIFQSSKYIADSTPLVASNAEIPGAQAAYSNDREIVGETSGQQIFSTAPTANHSSNRVLRTSLIRQMERLEGNFRLIAGPLEDGEEMADAFEVQGGDSLTRLRKKLSSGNYSVGRISLDSFDPDEFEKEEKMNFVVTDYIDETEATIGGVNVKTEEKQRTRREIPTIRLTVSEGHALKSEIRESCGEDSPVSHLSVKALIDLLSSAKCDIDASADNNFDTEERDFGTKMKSSTAVEIANARRSRRYDTDPSKGGSVLATQSDERIKQSSSTNSDDTVSDSSDSNNCIIVNGSSGVDTGNILDGGVTASSSSWVSRPESLTSQDSTPFTVKLADQEPASLSVPPSPFLADFLVLQSALRSPGAHASPTVCPIDLSRESRDANAGSTPARKAGVIGVGAADDNIIFVNEKRNRVKMLGGREKITPLETTQTLTTGQSDLQKVAEDPAALHRKKVKMRLAALSSTTRKSVGDGDNAQATVKRRLTASSTVSQRSLLEEQTDTLARLVEQRIHDRWLEAAKPLHQLPRSFR